MVVEVSVCDSEMAQRLGTGLALQYRRFVVTEAEGYWTPQA